MALSLPLPIMWMCNIPLASKTQKREKSIGGVEDEIDKQHSISPACFLSVLLSGRQSFFCSLSIPPSSVNSQERTTFHTVAIINEITAFSGLDFRIKGFPKDFNHTNLAIVLFCFSSGCGGKAALMRERSLLYWLRPQLDTEVQKDAVTKEGRVKRIQPKD